MNSIQASISEPYTQLSQQLVKLDRVQAASDILRNIRIFWHTCSRLKAHVGSSVKSDDPAHRSIVPSSRELPTAAEDLYKLEQIAQNSDLSGIEIVEREIEWILRVRQEVQSKASEMLSRGLETQNTLEVANALQVFENLKTLSENVHQSISILEEKINSSIRTVLDFASLSKFKSEIFLCNGRLLLTLIFFVRFQERSIISQTGPQTASWKATLWMRMEKLSDVLYQSCVQIWHLQRVVYHKGFKVAKVRKFCISWKKSYFLIY
jgi:conserved oligomeric Golgi complex subunit 5